MALSYFYSVRVYIEPAVYVKRQQEIYINHINALDNEQDATFIVSLIEAILN